MKVTVTIEEANMAAGSDSYRSPAQKFTGPPSTWPEQLRGTGVAASRGEIAGIKARQGLADDAKFYARQAVTEARRSGR